MQMRHVFTVMNSWYEVEMSFGFDALRKRAGKNRVCRAAEVRLRRSWPTLTLEKS